jgi:hypothetical protein
MNLLCLGVAVIINVCYLVNISVSLNQSEPKWSWILSLSWSAANLLLLIAFFIRTALNFKQLINGRELVIIYAAMINATRTLTNLHTEEREWLQRLKHEALLSMTLVSVCFLITNCQVLQNHQFSFKIVFGVGITHLLFIDLNLRENQYQLVSSASMMVFAVLWVHFFQ